MQTCGMMPSEIAWSHRFTMLAGILKLPATPLPIAAPPTPSRPSSAPALPPVPEESVEELPPVAPVDLLQALDNGNPEPLALPGSGSLSRRASTLSSFGVGSQPASAHAAPGTPVPALIRQASQVAPQTPPVSSRMEAAIDDARELEEESSSRKRTAEVDAEALRRENGDHRRSFRFVTTALVQNVFKAKNGLVSKFAKAMPRSLRAKPCLFKDTLEEYFNLDSLKKYILWRLPSSSLIYPCDVIKRSRSFPLKNWEMSKQTN